MGPRDIVHCDLWALHNSYWPNGDYTSILHPRVNLLLCVISLWMWTTMCWWTFGPVISCLQAEVAAPGLLYCAYTTRNAAVSRWTDLTDCLFFYQFSDHCILRPVQFVVAKCHNISMFTEKLFADRDRHNSLWSRTITFNKSQWSYNLSTLAGSPHTFHS